jgi:hypothetical protein
MSRKLKQFEMLPTHMLTTHNLFCFISSHCTSSNPTILLNEFAVAGPFLDKDQLDAVVEDLTQRSWIRIEEDSSLILTEEARERFAEIANRQDKVRKAVMKGISQEEYITVTRILQKMVDNLRL